MARIERAGPGDWELVREVRLRALATDPDTFGSTVQREEAWPPEVWQERLAADHPTLLAREDDGTPVGMAGGYAVPATGSGPVADTRAAMVWGMWVAPEARGRGHGAALLRAVLAWADTAGRTAYLHVSDGNPAARLYRAAGFEPTGKRHPLRPGSAIQIDEMVLRRGSGSPR